MKILKAKEILQVGGGWKEPFTPMLIGISFVFGGMMVAARDPKGNDFYYGMAISTLGLIVPSLMIVYS